MPLRKYHKVRARVDIRMYLLCLSSVTAVSLVAFCRSSSQVACNSFKRLCMTGGNPVTKEASAAKVLQSVLWCSNTCW